MASNTKVRILDVAARLFEAHGFEGTAVSAILRDAGVNSGSLYHFFPNKEGLLVSVLEHHLAQLDSLLDDAGRAADDPVERVFALLELYRGRLLVSGYGRGCPVGDLSLEIGARHPEARAVVDAYFASWTGRVSGWLGEAGERFPAGIDRDAIARHALAVMQGAVMQARAATSILPFDDSVGQLRALLSLLEGRPEAATTTARQRRPVRRTGDRPAGTRERESPEVFEPETGHETGVAADGPAWWRAW